MRLPFDRVLVINLARRADRMRLFAQNAAAAGVIFERVDAIDGHSLEQSPIPLDWQVPDEALNVGMLGCFLSHLTALKRIVESDWTTALILEDDVSFPVDFGGRFQELWANTPKHWDKLYLARGTWDETGAHNPERYLAPVELMGRVVQGVWKASWSSSAYAYAVNRKCVPYLLDNLRTINQPIDAQYASLHSALCVYAYQPALVHHSGVTESDIWHVSPYLG